MSTRTIATRLAIEGETEYKAKLKNINAELTLHKSELEKAQALHKSDANSLEALSAKHSALKGQMEALNQKHQEQAEILEKARETQQKFAAQTEELKGKLAELENSTADTAEEEKKLQKELEAAEASMQKAANSVTFYQKQLNNTERDQAKLGAELGRTEEYLDEAKTSADHCARSIDQYGKEVKEAGERSEQFGQVSAQAVNQLAAALAAAGVAKTVKEIADALMECVDTFGGFEAQMSAVGAISGADGGQMEQLADKAKQMGATTSFTAKEAGQALEYMAMAGWKTSDMLGGLEGIMNLAAASGENLASTSDIVTDALTAFGLSAADAGRFADVLAAASSNSNTNVSMMGETFKTAAPVAGALGYSIEDTALAIGLMANAGIKGSDAGTALRGTLTNLAKPSEQVAGYMERLGVSLTDNDGKVRSLSELLDVLRERFAGLTEAEQAEYAAGIAGKEAMSGLLAIVNAAEGDYQKLAEAINTCNGSAKEMSETRLDNYAGQMTLLASAADGLKLAVGEQLAPALTDLAEAGTDVLIWATDFVEGNPWVVGAIVGTTAAFGALTAGVILYEKRAELAAAKTALLNAVMNANPAVFIVAGIIGLATAIGTYIASVDDADKETKEFTQSLKESREAYEELTGSMAEQQGSTRSLAGALKDLLGTEEKSAAQKQSILRLVDQLNEAVPGLNLAYDEMGDSINMDADALDRFLEKTAQQETYEGQVERLSELYAQRAEISQRLAEAEEGLSAAQAESADYMASYFDIAVDYNNALDACGGTTGALENNVRELTAAQQANAAEIAELEAASRAYGERQAENALKVEAMTAQVDGLVAELRALEAAYTESHDRALESIEGQLGLFNELDGTAKTSIDSLIETLKGQVSYMETYAANIQRAMEMGVDEGLVRKLSDGSEESAQILDAIVKGGEEDIAALNEQLAKVEEGKESFSTAVAQMETDFDQKMGEIAQNLNDTIQEMDLHDETLEIGRNNIQGLIDGASDPVLRQELVDRYAQLGQAALAAYKAAVDQHSPSKKFEEAGRFDIKGVIQGAEKESQNLAAAYDAAAQTALEAMMLSQPTAIEEPPAVRQDRQMADIAAATVNAISGMVSSISDRPTTYQLVTPDGKVLAEYMADPLVDHMNANGTPIVNPIS
ncbi:MAG: phage tail tape measure protein [Oscillospiraceae bacterium]|jgi:TP901 family phage tail tape measure protein|nr:phage tail tape measure protein [Oscillospiraceae bacterium]